MNLKNALKKYLICQNNKRGNDNSRKFRAVKSLAVISQHGFIRCGSVSEPTEKQLKHDTKDAKITESM